MLSGLEIIEIIKEYIESLDEKIEASKMWGLNNRQIIEYTSQKMILEKLMEDIDYRIIDESEEQK